MVFPTGLAKGDKARMNSPVAAIIVAYHSQEVLPACLEALQGKVEQTVVIDNTPGQACVRMFENTYSWVHWIGNAENRGFATAVNQGIAATDSKFVLMLNPDCELQTRLDALIEACEAEQVAAAGGLLENQDGTAQAGFTARSLPTPWMLAFEVLGINRVWKRNPLNRRYRLLDMDLTRANEVEQPAGAFLMLRRLALAEIGGLDEQFHPAWFEDVDLCHRLREAGYVIRYTPDAVARHLGGHAVHNLSMHSRLQAWYGGLLHYAVKHYALGTHRWLRYTVLVGLVLRKSLCFFRIGKHAESSAYSRMFRLIRKGFPETQSAPNTVHEDASPFA